MASLPLEPRDGSHLDAACECMLDLDGTATSAIHVPGVVARISTIPKPVPVFLLFAELAAFGAWRRASR